MHMEMLIGKLAASVSVLGGLGMAATDIVLPKDMERWPVVALMAFVCVVSLGVTFFCVRKTFEAEDKRLETLNKLTVAFSQQTNKQEESNVLQREMNVKMGRTNELLAGRPCIIKKDE